MITVRQLLVDVERRLQQAGIETARTDAELLLAHVLGVSRTKLLIADSLTEEQRHNYELLVRRRVLREPLQYITGVAPFRRIELSVGPGVLVPRPETELIIDIAKRFHKPGIAIDLGSGSGCIALSLAVEIPDLIVLAVENSADAIKYLAANCEAMKPNFQSNSTVEIVEQDLAQLSSIRNDLIGKSELIVSNPPYVPQGSKVSAEVQYFEPSSAVFAVNNGYQVIDQVIQLAEELLKPGGLLILEHHESQGSGGVDGGVPARLKRSESFTEITSVDDLTGRPRFTYAKKVSQ